jgi:hypothetical protein
VLKLGTDSRVFTKLTLIPIDFICRSLLLFQNKKTLWTLNNDQQLSLESRWKKITNQPRKPVINYKNNRALIQHIKNVTHVNNQNNITRTASYLSFFKKHPEIRWTFLAHMVSRNAGYFMTDLKGEFLPQIINPSFSKQLFFMLEKGNSIIFQDAYPQLLLYEESKRRNQSLFYLCKHFNVSPFMEGVWEVFFSGDRSPLLPVAQIINEQSHIETNLIKSKEYQVLLSALTYRIQEWLQLSQIIFPVRPLKKTKGDMMQDFSKLEKRIELGQSLFHLLFHHKNFASVYKFANSVPHTGSRSDYDSSVFTFKSSLNNFFPKEKLSFFKTKKWEKLYSPKLNDAWDITYEGPFYSSNWFTEKEEVCSKIKLVSKPSSFVWFTYWAGIHKIETIYLIKEYYKLIKKKRPLKRTLFKK